VETLQVRDDTWILFLDLSTSTCMLAPLLGFGIVFSSTKWQSLTNEYFTDSQWVTGGPQPVSGIF